MSVFKQLSLINKGLRYKLMLAFSLMTIIPLLACFYIISSRIGSQPQGAGTSDLVILTALVVAILGLVLAKGIIDPVVNMATEVKRIASGEYDRKVLIPSEDELGNLGRSINSMTMKIKSNLDELRSYGQSMKEINVEIHKKVLALSSLLQIGNIISMGSIQIDPLLELAIEKAATLFDNGFGVLYMRKEEGGDYIAKTSYNVDKERMADLTIRYGGRGVLDKVLETKTILIIDKNVKTTRDLEEFKKSYNVKNIVAIPIYSEKTTLGILVIGTRQADFKYTTDDIDLVNVFAKHITIAIESDVLNRKNEELSIRDELTGLFNKSFVMMRLEEEIKRAIFYQRPCSLIVFNIDNFKNFRESRGELAAEEVLRKIAKLIKDNMIPVGKAARIGGDEFAMLLPEKNKREAKFIAEEIRKKVEATNLLKEGKAFLTVSCGVSENPIDGATSDEIYKKAMDTTKEAKVLGKNRVVS